MTDIEYLNVDLDLESSQSLAPLLRDFGDDFVVLHHTESGDRSSASLETGGSAHGPDTTINTFCAAIESLSPAGNEAWQQCRARIFNIGYQGGSTTLGDTGVRSLQSTLQPSTLARVAQAGAGLVITIHSPE